MSNKRALIAWAFYDWANSAFATTVLAGFFPIFFKQYWRASAAVSESTFWLGVANSVAGLVIMLSAPFLGIIADRASARKRSLFIFAWMAIVLTACLGLLAQDAWPIALLFFTLAVVGFMGSNIFYDALLPSVAPSKAIDRVSGLGYGLGYLGGGLLFALFVVMVRSPARFGFASAVEVTQWAFIGVAIWWAVFSIPLLLWVKEPPGQGLSLVSAVQDCWFELRDTLSHMRRLRPVFLFLLAYWLYIDGVDTIVRMAVDYGLSLGFSAADLVMALLITQFVGFPAAIVFGFLGQKIGAHKGILIGLGVYGLITVWGASMQAAWEFYGLAVVIGLVQGGVQSLSRSLYARLIPADRVGEFFGFYNMMGKFAAVIGPVMIGTVGLLTGSSRFAMLSLLILFVTGGWILTKVRVDSID